MKSRMILFIIIRKGRRQINHNYVFNFWTRIFAT